MYEHNALGYRSGLALCSSRARCPVTALINNFNFLTSWAYIRVMLQTGENNCVKEELQQCLLWCFLLSLNTPFQNCVGAARVVISESTSLAQSRASIPIEVNWKLAICGAHFFDEHLVTKVSL